MRSLQPWRGWLLTAESGCWRCSWPRTGPARARDRGPGRLAGGAGHPGPPARDLAGRGRLAGAAPPIAARPWRSCSASA
ncbi:hypothetical protein ACRAWD_19060 [Caulobacter segnis]